jgi:hypothetical protein
MRTVSLKLIIKPHPCNSSERKLQQDIWNSTPPARSITVKGEEPIQNSRDRSYPTNVHRMYLCDAAGNGRGQVKELCELGELPSIFQSSEALDEDPRMFGIPRHSPCLPTGERSPPATSDVGNRYPHGQPRLRMGSGLCYGPAK